jgi:uncharacterized protein YcbX
LSLSVAALRIYPVKSCAAVALDLAEAETLGLAGDRRFALLSEDGLALTQRDFPALATVRPSLEGGRLTLDLGGLAVLEIDSFTHPVTVDVWGKQNPGLAAPRQLTAPLADYLGAPLRLVQLERTAQRSFADSRPVLVTTSAMLAALNAALKSAVGMERFRPNVVLDGEIDGNPLRGREVTLEYEKPCGRCEVTTIDQASGARRGPEPLATLTERFKGEFGLYYRVTRPGRLRRGEEIT